MEGYGQRNSIGLLAQCLTAGSDDGRAKLSKPDNERYQTCSKGSPLVSSRGALETALYELKCLAGSRPIVTAKRGNLNDQLKRSSYAWAKLEWPRGVLRNERRVVRICTELRLTMSGVMGFSF